MASLGIGSLLGGLGLFLLGMLLLTDGLKLAAGPALARILSSSTQTPLRGLFSGVLVTALVQSSSVVTVAAIGFVNAGLLTFGQSLWVLFGANVGTTMTGWLVALVGFKIKVEVAALPLVGIGMALHVSGEKTRRGALGQALAGFGLLFLGIAYLQAAFSGVGEHVDLAAFGDGSVLSILGLVLVGALFTVLMQSSSAALAIVLTLAETGVLSLTGAAAAVIGANIGTTATALLAVIGATANARRAAAAHVLFNILTAGVALLLLPVLLHTVTLLSELLKMQTSPAVALALFHTVFNVLGVLLMWPFADRLAVFLGRRFVSRAEQIVLPRYIDRNIATVPALAAVALEREVGHFGKLVCTALTARIAVLGGAQATAESVALAPLARSIGEFVTQVSRTSMAEETAEKFAHLLRRQRHYAAVVELLPDIDDAAEVVARLTRTALQTATRALLARASEQVRQCEPEVWTASVDGLPTDFFTVPYEDWKAGVLAATARGELAVDAMDVLLRSMSALHRALDQLHSAALAGEPPNASS